MLVLVLQLALKNTELSVVLCLAADWGQGSQKWSLKWGVTNGQPECPLGVRPDPLFIKAAVDSYHYRRSLTSSLLVF